MFRTRRRPGPVMDAALGAASGLLASFVMSLVYRPLMRAGSEETLRREKEAQAGMPPATIRAAEAAAQAVGGGLPPDRRKQALGGKAVHYAYGALWGPASRSPRGPSRRCARSATGLAFGAALWLLSDEVLVPLLRFSRPPRRYPPSTHLKGLASHLVYGVAVDAGWRVARAPARRLSARAPAVRRARGRATAAAPAASSIGVRAPIQTVEPRAPTRVDTDARPWFLAPHAPGEARVAVPCPRAGLVSAPARPGAAAIDETRAALAAVRPDDLAAVSPLVDALLRRLADPAVGGPARRALFALLDGVRRRQFTTTLAPADVDAWLALVVRTVRGADYDFGELLRSREATDPKTIAIRVLGQEEGELTVADVSRRTRAIARGVLALVDGDPVARRSRSCRRTASRRRSATSPASRTASWTSRCRQTRSPSRSSSC